MCVCLSVTGLPLKYTDPLIVYIHIFLVHATHGTIATSQHRITRSVEDNGRLKS